MNEDKPLVVKPCSLGSSIGVRGIHDWSELLTALVEVFQYDEYALIEPMVVDKMEINVAVIGYRSPLASVVEVPASHSDILSYEKKYLSPSGSKKAIGSSSTEGMASMARQIDPSDLEGLDDKLKKEARDLACKAYQMLDCAGCARIDFIYDKSVPKLYFNEINTLPGSLAYYLWNASTPSLTYTELLTRLIDEALARKASLRGLKRNVGFRALSS